MFGRLGGRLAGIVGGAVLIVALLPSGVLAATAPTITSAIPPKRATPLVRKRAPIVPFVSISDSPSYLLRCWGDQDGCVTPLHCTLVNVWLSK